MYMLVEWCKGNVTPVTIRIALLLRCYIELYHIHLILFRHAVPLFWCMTYQERINIIHIMTVSLFI